MEGASSATSPMRSAAKFHSDARNGHRNAAGFVFDGVVREKQAHALGRCGRVFRHFERGQRGLNAGTVFERGEIENDALVFARNIRSALATNFLVETLARFVSEPAALHQLVEYCRKFAAGDALREVGGNVREDIDPDQIGEAKSSGAGPAERGAGERVHFFDGESLLEHEIGGVEHDCDADAIGDEVGRVVREDHLLAERAVGERGEGSNQRGIGVGGGDDLEQAHVARRIEEVRAKEFLPDLDWQCRGDLCNGQAGSIGT